MSGWVWLIIIIYVVFEIVRWFQKKKRKANVETLERKKKAEDYIMSSGDPEAIKMLMSARADPANYSQVLTNGMNRGNETLKIALGMMAGVIAGEMVSAAISASEISSAFENIQSELNATDTTAIDGAIGSDLDDGGGDADIDFD